MESAASLPSPQISSSNPKAAPASSAGPATARMHSTKMPRGRYLGDGGRVVHDVDSRLPGEARPPQPDLTPIAKYTDPGLVLGRQIAVNHSFLAYAHDSKIRVLSINTTLSSVLWGHTQRITDMAFFAEDVHLLASASVDGWVFVWKIDRGSEEEDRLRITGKVVTALQIVGDTESYHPHVCWHCHKQEILFVGIGNCVLKIDTTKVRRGKDFNAEEPLKCATDKLTDGVDVVSKHDGDITIKKRYNMRRGKDLNAEEPLKCAIDKLTDGVHAVGKHDGDITDLSIFGWMTTRLASASKDGTVKIWDDRKQVPLSTFTPHDGHPVNCVAFLNAPERPDHINLMTAGSLNREIKVWVSTGEEGWLLPSDSELWQCTQTLDLRSSSEPRLEEAFFNEMAVIPQANLIILANAKKHAIYAVHIDYGSCPASTHMDYIADFTFDMPILSLAGTCDSLPNGEQVVKVYCVQTVAVQRFSLELALCFPSAVPDSVPGGSVREPSVSRANTTVSEPVSEFTAEEGLKNGSEKMEESTVFMESVADLLGKGKEKKGKVPLEVELPTSLSETLNVTDSANDLVMQNMLEQKYLQKQMSTIVTATVTKEGKRVGAALRHDMEMSIKVIADKLWARFLKENAMHEMAELDRMQQLTDLITTSFSKELPAMFERTLKKEITAIGPVIACAITPIVEKTICSVVAESIQKGAGDKVVNSLDKSMGSRLEGSIARQLHYFQFSGNHGLQALRASLESSIIPEFERSCNVMFEQVNKTFHKGIAEHTYAIQQQVKAADTLACTSRETIITAPSIMQNLTSELLDVQRKLLAVVAAGNPKTFNPVATQATNGQLPGLPNMVEAPTDRTELVQLIAERKYEEAFGMALQMTDISIISWLCSQVDLHALCKMVPPPLSQGVLLALLHQLALDITNETTQKATWMTVVAVAINPSDPTIDMLVRPIFEHVFSIVSSVPLTSAPDAASVKAVIRIIKFVLMVFLF